MSPASDLSSPEHQKAKTRHQPNIVFPITHAQPLSDFRPANIGPQGRFANLPRSLWPAGLPRPREEQPQAGPSRLGPSLFNDTPQQPAASSTQQEQQEQQQDEEEEREDSPDPLDMFGQPSSDALIAHSFQSLSDDAAEFYTLQEAIELAFASRTGSRLPSEPNQWRDIKGRPDAAEWHAAALEEFNALLENGTFEPVQLPEGRRAIGCRWVFKLKRKADGTVDRFKARLVAKGFSQRPGLDFGQVFAPTARWAALRSIFALAALQDLELYSLDISNAFLNGELDHEVYMQTPEGFKDRFGAGFVLRLNRALYGLKQAGHQWHKKLDSVMSKLDFKLVRCDNSIWVYQRDSVHLIVPVYVDDMTIACKTRTEYEFLVQELKKHFKLKELGALSSLLGVQVERNRSKRLLTLS